MDYKQKYEEALERASKYYNANTNKGYREIFEDIFHEFKESEDERIRKALIERFKWELKGAEEQDAAGCSRQKDIEMFKQGIAWLEKQGEQELDIRYSILDKLIEADDIYQMSVNDAMICEARNKAISALSKLEIYKSLGFEKNVEQKPVEWNEEDTANLNRIALILLDASEVKEWWKEYRLIEKDEMEKLTSWLKSIKPQKHWKPSEEQLRAIINSAQGLYQCKEKEVLLDLYEQLKKL